MKKGLLLLLCVLLCGCGFVSLEPEEKVLDVKVLLERISQAKAVDEEAYTEASYENLLNVIIALESGIDTINTEEEVSAALQSLEDAFQALKSR